MSKHYDTTFWQIIKYYYNDDGTRKEYPPRKGLMQGEYYQKNWYRDKKFYGVEIKAKSKKPLEQSVFSVFQLLKLWNIDKI